MQPSTFSRLYTLVMLVLFNVFARLMRAAVGVIEELLMNVAVQLWDLSCASANLILPRRRKGAFYVQGQPGYKGIWPQYAPPQQGDSRSSCPALNALANHGILPRDGRNIPFKELSRVCRETYNFSPSFSYFVPAYFAGLVRRSYTNDTLDLSDLNAHNAIEHDASLTRHDIAQQPDQSLPAQDLIDELLSIPIGEGRDKLTASDLARFSTVRRAHSHVLNGQHTLSLFHKFFGSANSATMLSIFGGDVAALRIVLKEERLPEGWEPACKKHYGLTMAAFNNTVLSVECRIQERSAYKKLKGTVAAQRTKVE